MKVAIYARVSTDDKHQDPETQLYACREFCQKAEWEIVKEYVDRARAKDFKRRTSWQQLQKDARQRQFKTVLVFRLDRAFRSVRECANTLQDWFDYGIAFKSLREDVIDTTTSQGRFILHIMAAVAELESSIIGERVKAGIARTMAQGNRFGRKPLPIPVINVCDALQDSSSVLAAAEKLHCSRAYIYKVAKSYKKVAELVSAKEHQKPGRKPGQRKMKTERIH
jgi:DNA invertase Pin-like site-specific DNA recombinase